MSLFEGILSIPEGSASTLFSEDNKYRRQPARAPLATPAVQPVKAIAKKRKAENIEADDAKPASKVLSFFAIPP